MPQPVTTTDLFLQEVVGLLTEIRGLLQDAQPKAQAKAQPKSSSRTAIREPAAPAPVGDRKPAKRTAKK